MKYIIASDIHGSAYWCSRLVKLFEEEGADRLILLGDILYHGPRNALPDGYEPGEVVSMLNSIRNKLICVRGNCDAEVDQMVLRFPILSDSALICDFGQRVFASHGHIFSPDKLPPLCDGDIFLYGHTHIPADKQVRIDGGHIRCINPGSVSIPKNGSNHSCIIWQDGEFSTVIL